MMPRPMVTAALALVAWLPLASAHAADAVVNLYSSRHYDTDDAIYEAFTAASGIKVNVIEGDADELIERIKAEGRNSPADLFITVDAGRLYRAVEADILQPVTSPVLAERIPAGFRDPDNRWFGLSKRVRVIVTAKDRVQPNEIGRYEDLADPKWQGRLCIRTSTNVYNQSLVASMIAADGEAATEAWASGLVENFARPPQGADTDQILAVAAGECDAALANHYYLVRLLSSDDAEQKAAGEAVNVVFPNQADRGAHANISGIGLTRHAPNRDNAVKLMEFLTGDEAQANYAKGNSEYPIVESVKLPPILEALGKFKAAGIDAKVYGGNNAAAVKLMDRVGWQ